MSSARPFVDLSQFTGVFLEEAREHHGALEAGLLALERGDRDPELLNSIFRAAHSIKGASGTFGFKDITQFTHALETALDRVRGGTLEVTADLTRDLIRAVDVLDRLIDGAVAGTPMTPDDFALAQGLEHAGAHGAPAATPAAATPAAVDPADETTKWQVRIAPHAALLASGSDPLLLLRDLAELGELRNVVCHTEKLAPLATLDAEQCALWWEATLESAAPEAELRGVFLFVEDLCDVTLTRAGEAAASAAPAAPIAAITPAASTAPVPTTDAAPAAPRQQRFYEQSTIRVATEKVDALVNLVGELIIGQAMVTSITEHFVPERIEDLKEAVSNLDRHLRDLQERVLAVRMLPIGSLFGRFERVVRDVSNATGKHVALRTIGEDTELDKSVIEGLADPLTHLLRNAVDHGIEAADVREAAGKPAGGTVTLSAQHEAGSILVEIADDGGGLNLERIRAKGESLGLIRAGEVVSDDELRNLIFAPGFSTAATVSDLSGRGVGMDVVRRNVEALNGTINLDSTRGKGTTIQIRLPLTLAILDGMQVQLGPQVYVVPLLSIVESFRFNASVHRPVLGDGEVVLVRGTTLPLIRLSNIVGQPSGEAQGIVVVLEHGRRRIALLVDDLLGEQQVVVKNLETHYRRVDGILGATILGDGRVALILDVDALIRIGTASVPELAA